MNDIKEKYTCDACRYTFESDKLPDRCPDCGKLQVRRASESEIYEYEHRFDKEKESSRANLIALSHHRTCRSAYGGSTQN